MQEGACWNSELTFSECNFTLASLPSHPQQCPLTIWPQSLSLNPWLKISSDLKLSSSNKLKFLEQTNLNLMQQWQKSDSHHWLPNLENAGNQQQMVLMTILHSVIRSVSQCHRILMSWVSKVLYVSAIWQMQTCQNLACSLCSSHVPCDLQVCQITWQCAVGNHEKAQWVIVSNLVLHCVYILIKFHRKA